MQLSDREWLARADVAQQGAMLKLLTQGAAERIAADWDFLARPGQRAPAGDWRIWLMMAGRGFGKTRAGAEWVRSKVEGSRPLDAGACSRVALVGETIEQVREVMIFGDSGILACSPPDRRPDWEATRKRLG